MGKTRKLLSHSHPQIRAKNISEDSRDSQTVFPDTSLLDHFIWIISGEVLAPMEAQR